MALTAEQRRRLLASIPQSVLSFLKEAIDAYEVSLWQVRKARAELLARLVYLVKILPPTARSDRWVWRKILAQVGWSDRKDIPFDPAHNFLSIRSSRHLRRLARKIAASIPETDAAVAYSRALGYLSSDLLSEKVIRPFKMSPDDIEFAVDEALRMLELAFHHKVGGLWVLEKVRGLVHRLDEFRKQQLVKAKSLQ